MDTEGFDDICRFSPCDDIVPVCLFFLFTVRVSVSSCGCEGEGCTFAARLGDSEFGVSSCISYEEDFIEVSHSLLFLLLLVVHEVLSNLFHGLWGSVYEGMVFPRFFFDHIGMVCEVFGHEAFELCDGVFDED